MVTKDNQENEMLVGFCVDNPVDEEPVRDKKDTITTFNKLFKENIKYSMVSNVVDNVLKNKNSDVKNPSNENGKETSGMENIVELARSVINTKTPEDVKTIQKDFLTAFKGSLSTLKADIPLGQIEIETTKRDIILKYKSHADWKINFYDKHINYLALFVDNCSVE